MIEGWPIMDIVSAARRVVELIANDADIGDELADAADHLRDAADGFEQARVGIYDALGAITEAADAIGESLGQGEPEPTEGEGPDDEPEAGLGDQGSPDTGA